MMITYGLGVINAVFVNSIGCGNFEFVSYLEWFAIRQKDKDKLRVDFNLNNKFGLNYD